jgi:hypothetical protein
MGDRRIRTTFDVAMQLVTRMAISANHALLAEVNVGPEALTFVLAQEFVADPTAVTGRTGAGHRWRFFEVVTIQQTAANTGRLADMAIAATGMAAGTMITEHFLHFGMFG